MYINNKQLSGVVQNRLEKSAIVRSRPGSELVGVGIRNKDRYTKCIHKVKDQKKHNEMKYLITSKLQINPVPVDSDRFRSTPDDSKRLMSPKRPGRLSLRAELSHFTPFYRSRNWANNWAL